MPAFILIAGAAAQTRTFAQFSPYALPLSRQSVLRQNHASGSTYPFDKFKTLEFSTRSPFFASVQPTVNFIGVKHNARVTGQIAVGVRASDEIGIRRAELYIDGTFFAAQDVFPSNPNISIYYKWNTALIPNGKHTVQAQAYNNAGIVQTATWIVFTNNAAVTLPLPTVFFVAEPSTIFVGQSATLSWVTSDAATVMINQGIGTVAQVGSLTITPAKNITYTLTAANKTGSVSKTATVTVTTSPTGNNITLLPNIIFQTIDGWEATGEAGQLHSPAWNNYKEALLDQAVNDLGINRIRAEILSGTENPVDHYAQWRSGQISESQYNATRFQIINDNDDPNSINPNGFKWSQLDAVMGSLVIPIRQRLKARGESLWLSINYVDFGTSTFEHKNNPAEYAEFVLATYQHLQGRYGFVPNSWEIILEPDTSTAGWSAAQVGQAIKAAGDRLSGAGFTPRFVAPSTTNGANAPIFIDQIAQTKGAMQYVGEFSYHRYCCVSDNVLQEIFNRAATYNKRTAMLEWIGADYETLHQDLKIARNSSWQQYTLAGPIIWGPDDGSRYYIIDDTNAANPQIIIGSRTKFLRQYFRFIRSGAQRIEARTNNANFEPLAFINPNSKYVVVVKAAAEGSFNIQGLPAGTYGIKFTTASQYNVDFTDVVLSSGQQLTTHIPASGVITVFAR